MVLVLLSLALVGIVTPLTLWRIRIKRRAELAQSTINADQLHALLLAHADILLLDVRLPLDVLAYPSIIPGARRVTPQQIMDNPAMIPTAKDTIAYCTCPGDETSRKIVRKARALHFNRVKLLTGGLEGWQAKGFPVEPYTESFHLDTLR